MGKPFLDGKNQHCTGGRGFTEEFPLAIKEM